MRRGDTVWHMMMRSALSSLKSALSDLDANNETDLAGDVNSVIYELEKRIQRVIAEQEPEA